MKIGVFDSGLGGLIVTKAFLDKLGQYDYVYLGDTKNLPYGEKSPVEVLNMTVKGMEFLIEKGASIIIIACNTASCVALRYLQRVYMPKHHPEVKVLGVIVPTVEEAIEHTHHQQLNELITPHQFAKVSEADKQTSSPARGEAKSLIGVVATKSTVSSHIYKAEIQKIAPNIDVVEVATPKLVPLIEAGNMSEASKWVKRYVDEVLTYEHRAGFSPPRPKGHPSVGGELIGSLILGCTHYPLLKEYFRKYLPDTVKVISQDEFMGEKLASYLRRHPVIESALGKNGTRDFFVSEIQNGNIEGAKKIIDGARLELARV